MISVILAPSTQDSGSLSGPRTHGARTPSASRPNSHFPQSHMFNSQLNRETKDSQSPSEPVPARPRLPAGSLPPEPGFTPLEAGRPENQLFQRFRNRLGALSRWHSSVGVNLGGTRTLQAAEFGCRRKQLPPGQGPEPGGTLSQAGLGSLKAGSPGSACPVDL